MLGQHPEEMYMCILAGTYHFSIGEFDLSLSIEMFLGLSLHTNDDVAVLHLLPSHRPVGEQLKQ